MAGGTVVLAVAAVGVLIAVGVAAADDGYVRERSETYALHDIEGNPHPSCRGETWIGQTTSNTIEAYSLVRCPADVRPAFSRAYVAIHSGSPLPAASRDETCLDCSTITASTSTSGGPPGTTWCALGHDNIGAELIEAYRNVCITT